MRGTFYVCCWFMLAAQAVGLAQEPASPKVSSPMGSSVDVDAVGQPAVTPAELKPEPDPPQPETEKSQQRPIVIELPPGKEFTEAFRRFAQGIKLRQSDVEIEEPGQGRAAAQDIVAELRLTRETEFEPIDELVQDLRGYGVTGFRFSPTYHERNSLTITAPHSAPWTTIKRLTDFLAGQKGFTFDLRVRGTEDPPTSTQQDPNASPVPPGEPRAVATPDELAAAAARAEPVVKIFHLEYVNPEDAVRTIEQLYGRDPVAVAVISRANSVYIRGKSALVEEVEALLREMDQAPPEDLGKKTGPEGLADALKPDVKAIPGQTNPEPLRQETEGKADRPSKGDSLTSIYALKHVPASTARDAISNKVPDAKLAVEEKGNRLIVVASQEEHRTILDLIRGLDQGGDDKVGIPDPAEPLTFIYSVEHIGTDLAVEIVSNAVPGVRVSIYQPNLNIVISASEVNHRKVREILQRLDRDFDPDLDRARRLYHYQEAQVAKIASDLRGKPLVERDPAEMRNLKAQVAEAFILRQQLQRGELAEFAQRLERLRGATATRQRIANEIVDRRVQELLDPDLKWDAVGAVEAAPNNAAAKQAIDNIKQAKEQMVQAARQAFATPGEIATEKSAPHRPLLTGKAVEKRKSSSDAEKAVGKLVFVFAGDLSRRAVPCLLVKVNGETLAVSAGPASIVPDGTVHAIDRTFVEVADRPAVSARYDRASAQGVALHRVDEDLTSFELTESVPMAVGDSLECDHFSFHDLPLATVVAMNVETDFSLASHKFNHHYTGLIEVNRSLPEGTPLFKEGKLAGLTLLGSRFLGEKTNKSYVIPTVQILAQLSRLDPAAEKPETGRPSPLLPEPEPSAAPIEAKHAEAVPAKEAVKTEESVQPQE